MADNSEAGLNARKQALLEKGRLSRSEVQDLNDIQRKLRTKSNYTYNEQPNVKQSDGEIVAKKGIGGFVSERVDSVPETPSNNQAYTDASMAFQGYSPVASNVNGGTLYSQSYNTPSRNQQRSYTADETNAASLRLQGFSAVGTSTAGKVIYSYTEPKKARNYFGIRPKSESFSGTFESKQIGSNIESSTYNILSPTYGRTQNSISAVKTPSKGERIVAAFSSFAGGGSEKVTNANQISIGTTAAKDPKTFLKGAAAGAGIIATIPLSGYTIFQAGSFAYGLDQSIKTGKTAISTGEGYGKAAFNVGLTTVDAFLLKGSLKGAMSTRLISSTKKAETPFVFQTPTRGGFKASPVVNSQTNVVALKFTGDKEALNFASTQALVKGSRTLRYEDTYKTIFGEMKTARLVEQQVTIKGYNLRGSSSSTDFELALGGQGKLAITSRTLTVPKGQYGVKARQYAREIPDQKALFAANKEISSKNLFSVKNADRSNSPFAYAESYQSGRIFSQGRFTPINDNFAQVGLSSQTILGTGRRARVTRQDGAFLNEVQSRKPDVIYNNEIYQNTEFTQRSIGTAEFTISGRSPTKTLTSFDSPKSTGELLSRETNSITRYTEGSKVSVTQSQLQFGKVRSGSRERAPLFDINEFTPYTDTLTSRRVVKRSVNDQFGISAETLSIEKQASDIAPTQTNFFPDVPRQTVNTQSSSAATILIDKPLPTIGSQKGTSMLKGLSVSTAPGIVSSIKPNRFTGSRSANAYSRTASVSVFAQQSPQSASVPRFGGQLSSNIYTRTVTISAPSYRSELSSSLSRSDTRSSQQSSFRLTQINSLQQRFNSKSDLKNSIRSEFSSLFSQSTEQISKSSTRLSQVSKLQNRLASRSSLKLGLSSSPRGFSIPQAGVRVPESGFPSLPPIPLFDNKRSKKSGSRSANRARKAYTPSITALFQQRNIFKIDNKRRSKGIGVISGLGVRN